MKSALSSKEITNQSFVQSPLERLGAVASLRFCPTDYATGDART
jgi:hypothetical protein